MWSDREAERDCLGFTSYVNVLADICTHGDLAPLTLGIFGPWGSGKTSLMRMLKRRIERDAAERKAKTLWFNAWRYEGRDEAQSALIHAILAKLGEDKTLLQDAHEYFDRLKKGASVLKLAKHIGKTVMTMTPNIGEFIDCFREESEKVAETMESFEGDFEALLERAGVEHVIVFIDDLDRCSSEKVIETFETIKLFLNTPACTFVIGADAAKIEQAVGDVYRVADGQRQKDFLEKIVQVPFTIPEQDLKDIACYVGMLVIGRHLRGEGGWEELERARPAFLTAEGRVEDAFLRWPLENGILFDGRAGEVIDELKGVLPYTESLARGLRGNPRQIKRFLNILALRRRLAQEDRLEVRPEVLVKLCVLEYVWGDFFNAVVETVDPSTGYSDLIGEMMRVALEEGAASESKLVKDWLEQPGLVGYLTFEPRLGGEIDLRPYLFLAQTSLSRTRPAALLPVDEEARSVARGIESDDPLVTKTAARRAAAKEPAVASSVVRILLGDLPTAKDSGMRTSMINGLDAICRSHKDQYGACVKALAQIDPSGDEAVAVALGAFLTNAERAGFEVPEDLKKKVVESSPIAAALAPTKPRNRRPPVGGL
jgi:hypothetical protein